MSTYKTFAIAGINGDLSKGILKNFLELPEVPKIYVLSRSSDSPIPSHPNVSLITIDYSSAETAAKAIEGKGIDVVVSTFGQLSAQAPLVEAAAKVGVKLFVPSEFGTPGHPNGPFQAKLDIQNLAKSLNLPTAIVMNGFFSEFMPIIFGKETITIVGKGNTPISTTSREDVARFVPHLLTTATPEKLRNSVWRLESMRLTANEIAELLKKKYGGKVVYKTVEEAKAGLGEPGFGGFLNFLGIVAEEGRATVTWELETGKEGHQPNAKQFWPEWKPKTLEEVLEGMKD